MTFMSFIPFFAEHMAETSMPHVKNLFKIAVNCISEGTEKSIQAYDHCLLHTFLT